MSFIQQVTDESCFVRLIWDDGTEQDINKADIKIFLREELVVVEDDSPFSAEIDYTKVTTPLSASALILHDTIVGYADTNPCDAGGGGSGDVVGPASSTNNNFAIFDGATGKLLKDTGVDASDFDAAGAAAAAQSAAQSYADGLIIDSIADADTTHAPSRNAVFDALALKANATDLFTRLILTAGDQTTTAATGQNITALVTPTLTINKRYHFRGFIHGGCNNTGGIKYAVTIPTGATIYINYKGSTTGVTAYGDSANIVSGTLTNAFCTENNANRGVYVEGEIALAGTAGTVQFQFASTTAGQTSTIYQLGTMIEFKQLD